MGDSVLSVLVYGTHPFLPSQRIINRLLYRFLTRDLLPAGITHISELFANYPEENKREGSVQTSIFGLPLGLGSTDTWYVFVCKALPSMAVAQPPLVCRLSGCNHIGQLIRKLPNNEKCCFRSLCFFQNSSLSMPLGLLCAGHSGSGWL